jgi:hypothetical protein
MSRDSIFITPREEFIIVTLRINRHKNWKILVPYLICDQFINSVAENKAHLRALRILMSVRDARLFFCR